MCQEQHSVAIRLSHSRLRRKTGEPEGAGTELAHESSLSLPEISWCLTPPVQLGADRLSDRLAQVGFAHVGSGAQLLRLLDAAGL